MCTEFLTAAGALYERERSNGERAGAVEELLREKRLAGAEDDERVSQCSVNSRCERVCTTEHAPRDPFRLFERRNGLAEIVERGARVQVERRRVIPPQSKREWMTLSENASRNGPHLAQERLVFFEAI